MNTIERVLEGRTTFVIAHRLSTVRNADRIVVVDEGEIVEMGTHDDLAEKRGLYQRMASRQFHDVESPSIGDGAPAPETPRL